MKVRSVHGLTLIEVMVAIAIAAIMAGLAAPSFLGSINRGRLEGAVTSFGIDLQYARSEAIRRRTTATVTIPTGGASYQLTYTTTANTQADLKTVTMPTGVTLSPGTIAFEGLRGTTGAQTVTATGVGAQLQVTTNAVGRITTCSLSGISHGFTAC